MQTRETGSLVRLAQALRIVRVTAVLKLGVGSFTRLQIDLFGGGSRIPCVREALARRFELRHRINTDEAAAMGAARLGGGMAAFHGKSERERAEVGKSLSGKEPKWERA
jgi:molecular chaperone DnaK (HSP70)